LEVTEMVVVSPLARGELHAETPQAQGTAVLENRSPAAAGQVAWVLCGVLPLCRYPPTNQGATAYLELLRRLVLQYCIIKTICYFALFCAVLVCKASTVVCHSPENPRHPQRSPCRSPTPCYLFAPPVAGESRGQQMLHPESGCSWDGHAVWGAGIALRCCSCAL